MKAAFIVIALTTLACHQKRQTKQLDNEVGFWVRQARLIDPPPYYSFDNYIIVDEYYARGEIITENK